jgi:glutamyl-Q tRNA(Asp) synthetase
MSSYVGRFAPSPTGALHFGSLVAALGSWLFARAAQGQWLVRMEDIDPPREVAGAAAQILATLAAFGLQSDAPVLYQSTRRDAYAAALQRLIEQGAAFPCRCSRSDLETRGGVHGAVCAASDPARAPAWRVRAPEAPIVFHDALCGEPAQDLARDVGAFVLQRVDGLYAYQLAVVVDDSAQGVTQVVRGADLLDSTPRQIWLQRLLGLPTPSYAHLPLVLDASGRKLSKQDRALPVDPRDPLPALRAALRFLGFPAREVAGAATVARLLQRAVAHFDPARIPCRRTATEPA